MHYRLTLSLGLVVALSTGCVASQADLADEEVGGVAGALHDGHATVVLEAEQFFATFPRGGQSWNPGRDELSAAGGLVRSSDSGASWEFDYVQKSPELLYQPFFPKAGTYYVWVRAHARNADADTVHVGLNHRASETSDRISGFDFPYGHVWSRATADGPDATLAVPFAGNHNVNVWMSEDGINLDKIILTTDPDFEPDGFGPPASGPAVCGDGRADVGEQCDDRNMQSGDGCSETCETEAGRHRPFLEANGYVAFDGEHYETATATDERAWDLSPLITPCRNPTHCAFGRSIRATPDNGVSYEEDALADSPSLVYPIRFDSPGTYRVWVRGIAPGSTSDSVFVGLDGVPVAAISGFGFDGFTWSQRTEDGGIATVEIATPGVHQLNVWMREDGFGFDQIILTQDTSLTPRYGVFPSSRVPDAVCGNGVVETGELCDDGNTDDFDACDAVCQSRDFVTDDGTYFIGPHFDEDGREVYTEAFFELKSSYLTPFSGTGDPPSRWVVDRAQAGTVDVALRKEKVVFVGMYVQECGTGAWVNIDDTVYAPLDPPLRGTMLNHFYAKTATNVLLDTRFACPRDGQVRTETVWLDGAAQEVVSHGRVHMAYVVQHR